MGKKWPVWLATMLLLFNAFLVTNKLPEGLFSAKEIGLWLGTGFATILIVIIVLVNKAFNIKLKSIDFVVMAFLVLLPLGGLVIRGDEVNSPVIITQLAYGLFYIAFRIMFSNISVILFVNMIMELFVILLCFQLMIALAQNFSLIPSYYPRFGATGMFFNPGPFAIFTSALFVVVWTLFLQKIINKEYLKAMFYCILIIIAAYFIIKSLSRSAWLGSLAGLFIGSSCMLFTNFKLNIINSISRISVYALLLASIPFCYWLYQFKSDSAIGRVLIWKVTGLMLKENWIAGVGRGNFAVNYLQYQADFFNVSRENVIDYGNIAGDNRYSFNDLLMIFCEGGIIELILFLTILMMCGQLLVKVFKQKRKYIFLTGACAASALTALLVAGFTAYPLSMLPIGILFWFMIAVVVNLAPGNEIIINSLLLKSVVIILLIVSGLSYVYLGINRFNTYRQWTYATADSKNNEDKLRKLLLLYDRLKTNADYLNDLAVAYIIKKEFDNAILPLSRAVKFSPYKGYFYELGLCYEKTGNYQAAILQYKKVRDAIPNLIKPRYLLAMLYYHKGDSIAFKKKALEVIEFTPKINSMEVVEIKNELSELLNRPQM